MVHPSYVEDDIGITALVALGELDELFCASGHGEMGGWYALPMHRCGIYITAGSARKCLGLTPARWVNHLEKLAAEEKPSISATWWMRI